MFAKFRVGAVPLLRTILLGGATEGIVLEAFDAMTICATTMTMKATKALCVETRTSKVKEEFTCYNYGIVHAYR